MLSHLDDIISHKRKIEMNLIKFKRNLRQNNRSSLWCIEVLLLHQIHNLSGELLHFCLKTIQFHTIEGSRWSKMRYGERKGRITSNGLLSVRNWIPGIKCSQRGKPLFRKVKGLQKEDQILPVVPFSTCVWTDLEMHIWTCCCYYLHKFDQIASTFKIILPSQSI